MMIRQECPSDRNAILTLVTRAFGGPQAICEPQETGLLARLFECDGYDQRYSLVAEDEGRIIGFAIATWGAVGEQPVLGLGPIAVEPGWQRRGIGGRLLAAMDEEAPEQEQPAMILLGHTTYYPRFGYEPAMARGIEPSDPAWGDHFMVKVYDAQRVPVGAFRYAEPFGC